MASPTKSITSPHKKMTSPTTTLGKKMASPSKKMASPSKASPSKRKVSPTKQMGRSVSFIWDIDSTKALLELCIEFQSIHGRKQQFKWPEIARKFEEHTGRCASVGTLRNKMEVMKRHYHLWKRLKGPESGLGVDPVTGKIDADPGWWEKKIKENSEFSKFQNKGVLPEIDNLWERVFGDSYATGEHCVAPGMDNPSMSTPPDLSNDSQPEPMIDDLEDLVNDLQRLDTHSRVARGSSTSTPVHSTTPTTPSGSTSKRMSEEPFITTPGGSKRPRLSRGAAAFQDTLEDLRTEGRRAYDLIANVCSALGSSTSVPEDSDKQVRDAFEILYRMVNDGLLEPTTDIFCFATSKILDDNGRKGFMYLKSDDHRLAWLKYEMEKK